MFVLLSQSSVSGTGELKKKPSLVRILHVINKTFGDKHEALSPSTVRI